MILHVCSKEEWARCEHLPSYAPAAFERESFIHCCHDEQLAGVLSRYFAGKKNLLLLHIDDNVLQVDVKYEAGATDEKFPHVYGFINKDAIMRVEEIW